MRRLVSIRLLWLVVLAVALLMPGRALAAGVDRLPGHCVGAACNAITDGADGTYYAGAGTVTTFDTDASTLGFTAIHWLTTVGYVTDVFLTYYVDEEPVYWAEAHGLTGASGTLTFGEWQGEIGITLYFSGAGWHLGTVNLWDSAPSATPTPSASPAPTASPSPAPTASPSPAPTASPSPAPTASPSPAPSVSPTPGATGALCTPEVPCYVVIADAAEPFAPVLYAAIGGVGVTGSLVVFFLAVLTVLRLRR